MKVSALVSRASLLRLSLLMLIPGAAALLPGAASQGQQQPPKAEAPQPPGPAAPITALVEQLADLFPKVEGEVLEVRGDTVTLGLGHRNGLHPGLNLELYRAGREIRHPRTGQVLGRTEESLGSVRVSEVQETFSQAQPSSSGEVKPGDRVRMSSAKIRITLLPLLGSVRETLVDAATNEIVERLSATGRFQVGMGDAINVFLSQEGLKAEDVLQGRGVKKVIERFKVEHLLAVHFQRVQGRPFMEVRFFSAPREDAAVTMAFFVPPSIRSASQGGQFSNSRSTANPPSAKPRSLLSRLLGGDVDPGSYSSAESTIPLREVARFPFPVLTMDVGMHPADKTPRMVVSDGERVYMYRISGQKLDAEWSISARGMGRVMTIQLVDLNIVGTRWHPDSGLNSFIIEFKDGKPRFLIDDIGLFLIAMDTTGGGYKQTLWAQALNTEKFFNHGHADQMALKDGKLVTERPATVHSAFRPTGVTMSNISGKDTRALAFIDDFNRLQVSLDGQDLWRSSSPVGGGYVVAEQINHEFRGGRSKFYKFEPVPVSVDLDGDGIDEIVVPQNTIREGLLAVVFKGPAGIRLQSVESGFEGAVTALGAFRTDENNQPTLVAAVVRFQGLLQNFLKRSGDTQIIMTIPQD
jgi:hypothetical protein